MTAYIPAHQYGGGARAMILKITFLILALLIISMPASAELQYFKTPMQNNPLSLRVQQGDTIYLGKTYDLSGVFGVSGQYAYWKNWKSENQDCTPDQIIDINYYRTRVNRTAALIGPPDWTPGNWYYWDIGDCSISHYDLTTHQVVTRNAPLDHDNKFAFKVIKPQSTFIQNQLPEFKPIEEYKSAYQT